jgi:protein gp37
VKSKVLTPTKIEWTDCSWNPIRARNLKTGKAGWHCEHASEECRLCYSETLNGFRGTGLAFTRQNRHLVEVFLDKAWLNARMPSKPSKVFVCDMTDLFRPFVRDDWIAAILAVIARHPEHVFQLLTKRPERMAEFFAKQPPPGNVWVGTSIGERRWKPRLDSLRQIPATVRFVSLEPLLEDLGALDLDGIGWVIAGAESDAHGRARPMQLDWVRAIRDQCIDASVPFFFKQDAAAGGRRKLPLPELDGRQWREFPVTVSAGAKIPR